MGAPVSVSPESRAKTRSLAAAIVAAVENDERMPHGLLDTRIDGQRIFLADQVESLVMEMAQEICALTESADRAAERLLFCMHIYRGYRVGESRGPNGCLFDAIEATRPDIAAELREGLDEHDAYAKYFDENGAPR